MRATSRLQRQRIRLSYSRMVALALCVAFWGAVGIAFAHGAAIGLGWGP